MVELGLQSGLRVGEMASLQHSNLLTANGRSSLVVTGKGNKRRAIWISSRFKKTCERYIGLKTTLGYTTDDESYLLNNCRDSRISRRALQKAFKEIVKLAGLPDHYYIHCLRHTYTTFLLKASNNMPPVGLKPSTVGRVKTGQVYVLASLS
jgi:integrase/recombinase XerC